MAENKASKSNGLGTDPMQRLASLKAPRDLMLGGIKPNKKVYIPNLNVARNKNKGVSTTNTRDHNKDDKGPRDKKNNRNKNLNNGPKVIKSTGVFSEGLGNSERRSSRFSYGRDSEPVQVMQKPTIRVKDVIKIDKELEEQKIKSVVGDSGDLDDDDDVVDFKQSLEVDAPIKLPMDDGAWMNTHVKPNVKVKQEIIVKKEPGIENDCGLTEQEEKPIPDVKEVFENTDVVNLLKSEKSTLILLQLPDTLPGRGGRVEDDTPKKKSLNTTEQPSTSTNDKKDEKPVDNKCLLSDLEEGRIGKLRIHRSGRVTLALGDTIFEVSKGTKAAFHQELVSVGCDEKSRSASIVALGPLHHKLNILPDWEAMFRDMPV